MYRAVYISEATCPINARTISQILETSRQNNARDAITGLLILHQNRFFQVLEGPNAKIQACVGRIRADPRHCGVVIIDHGAVAGRAFPGWRMGYSTPQELITAARDSVFSIYDLIPPNSEARGGEPQVRRHVRDFLAAFERLAPSRAGFAG